MDNLKFKTRNGSNPKEKTRVYFCCHLEDFNDYFDLISDEILSVENCAIWYSSEIVERDDNFYDNLKKMNLFVIPVTTKLLNTSNVALDVDFKFAIENHIPILPIMLESGLEKLFNRKCGDIQFLDRISKDPTAISYKEKLKKYLATVLLNDSLAEKIRAAFDAYIFLSYRKKDRKYADELMRLVHKNDFCRDIAIWYDEYLTPGEDFNESIVEAIKKSDLFMLAVTPNLVNETNYVMQNEYPLAKQEGKLILSAELVPTDKDKLTENYEGVPTPVNAHDEVELSQALLENIKKLAIKEKDGSPEHNFFIGLAYLNGIDVEIDTEKAVSLITYAAENDCVEAMQKLVEIYTTGNGVARDYSEAISWKIKLNQKLKDEIDAELQELNNRKRMIDGVDKKFKILREKNLHAPISLLQVSYEYNKSFKYFLSDLVGKFNSYAVKQGELASLYKQSGDNEMCYEILENTIDHRLNLKIPELYSTIDSKIMTGELLETSFFDLFIEILDAAILERDFANVDIWYDKCKKWLQQIPIIGDSNEENNVKLLGLKLELKVSQCLFEQGNYPKALELTTCLSEKVYEFLKSLLPENCESLITPENMSLDESCDNGIILSDGLMEAFHKVMYATYITKIVYVYYGEMSFLDASIRVELGLLEDALKRFEDVFRVVKKIDEFESPIVHGGASKDIKLDGNIQFLSYLNSAEISAKLNNCKEQEYIEQAKKYLEYNKSNTIENSTLKKKYLKTCGDVYLSQKNVNCASVCFEDALEIAKDVFTGIPSAENILDMVELYIKLCNCTTDAILIKEYLDSIYNLIESEELKEDNVSTKEILGQIYLLTYQYDNNKKTGEYAYDVFCELASDYPTVNRYANKRDELKNMLNL